jgi:hypothetical protein
LRTQRSTSTLVGHGRGLFLFFCLIALASPAIHAAPPSLDDTHYHDYWHHKDGSDRYTFELGAGASFTAGAAKRYQNTSGSFRFGGGYNVNKLLSVLLEYDFNNFGVPSAEIISLYGSPDQFIPGNNTGVSGRVHLWSITADPVIHHHWSERSDTYLVGGGGFYRKLVTFNYQTPLNCAGCLNPPSTVGQFSNNAGGLNLGLGHARTITYDSYVKWFIEARYVWIDNKPVSPNSIGYPPVAYRTGYFPATVGLRW